MSSNSLSLNAITGLLAKLANIEYTDLHLHLDELLADIGAIEVRFPNRLTSDCALLTAAANAIPGNNNALILPGSLNSAVNCYVPPARRKEAGTWVSSSVRSPACLDQLKLDHHKIDARTSKEELTLLMLESLLRLTAETKRGAARL